MGKVLFVGETRSPTAKRKGWTWKDGRLAAKPLFEALQAMGVDPLAHEFVNLWTDGGVMLGSVISRIRRAAIVVALGQRVSRELRQLSIEHVALVHPAARGAIRKRERYHAHVAARLGAAFDANAVPKSDPLHLPGLVTFVRDGEKIERGKMRIRRKAG